MGALVSWESICLTSRGSAVSDPVNSHIGPVVEAVITSPCHGEDRGFDSRRDRWEIVRQFQEERPRYAQLVMIFDLIKGSLVGSSTGS